MNKNRSIEFFDIQFRTQPVDVALRLNPFEVATLPYLVGDVLDFGCGMGNLTFEAAKQGCKVLALDGSQAAIDHINKRAANEGYPVSAKVADLRNYSISGQYDCVVSIGLLMFFACGTASNVLNDLKAHVRPGGVIAINVLIDGTTYLDMFDISGHCLFTSDHLQSEFAVWSVEHLEFREFDAPRQTIKKFCTLIARKPELSSSTR